MSGFWAVDSWQTRETPPGVSEKLDCCEMNEAGLCMEYVLLLQQDIAGFHPKIILRFFSF
jgi:hypothetical protein